MDPATEHSSDGKLGGGMLGEMSNPPPRSSSHEARICTHFTFGIYVEVNQKKKKVFCVDF